VNEVTKLLASYISGVRSAHKDASQLHNELTALCFVLEQIRDLLVEEQDKGTAFNRTLVLVSVLGLATSHVSDLFKKLNKINNPTGNKIFNFFSATYMASDPGRLREIRHCTTESCTNLSVLFNSIKFVSLFSIERISSLLTCMFSVLYFRNHTRRLEKA
jgi:hypothetical protein